MSAAETNQTITPSQGVEHEAVRVQAQPAPGAVKSAGQKEGKIVAKPKRYDIQLILQHPSGGWARVWIDDRGVLAVFGDDFEDVAGADAEFINISKCPQFIEGYIILKIDVFEVYDDV